MSRSTLPGKPTIKVTPVIWTTLLERLSNSNENDYRRTFTRTTFDKASIPRVRRGRKVFPTGSAYTGEWSIFGMAGLGVYEFAHGPKYQGEFKGGEFHGAGAFYYEDGTVVHGWFYHGTLVERRLVFHDGMVYAEDGWEYCGPSDRRFALEHHLGLKPAGNSLHSCEQPTPELPEGCYDVGYGIYCLNQDTITSYDDFMITSDKTHDQKKWLMNNCRKGADKPIGPCPHLYEQWSEPTLKLRAASRTSLNPGDIRQQLVAGAETYVSIKEEDHIHLHPHK